VIVKTSAKSRPSESGYKSVQVVTYVFTQNNRTNGVLKLGTFSRESLRRLKNFLLYAVPFIRSNRRKRRRNENRFRRESCVRLSNERECLLNPYFHWCVIERIKRIPIRSIRGLFPRAPYGKKRPFLSSPSSANSLFVVSIGADTNV